MSFATGAATRTPVGWLHACGIYDIGARGAAAAAHVRMKNLFAAAREFIMLSANVKLQERLADALGNPRVRPSCRSYSAVVLYSINLECARERRENQNFLPSARISKLGSTAWEARAK